jgi:hypothetical protein
MKYKLILLETARQDIQDAFEWYNMQSAFAAGYLIERLDEAFNLSKGASRFQANSFNTLSLCTSLFY